MKNFKLIAVSLLVVAVIALSFLLNHALQEKSRLKSNQHSLLSEVEFYKVLDSLNVASVEKLTLSNAEFRRFNSGLVSTIELLNLKVRSLQSASQTVTATGYTIAATVKDSIVYRDRDRPPDTLRCIDYRDAWLTVAGCIRHDRFNGTIQSIDTIEQFVHRVPRKLLFIKYGTKAIRQEVISKNPHTAIVYTKYIELK